MKEENKLPKGLYDVVSELVNFIDNADYDRKQKSIQNTKDYIENTQSNNNVKKLF